jgi:hypothetical protein
MGRVIQFTKFGVSFEPETLKALGAAYDLAMTHLSNGLSEKEAEDMALRMIDAAKQGHRNVDALYAAALSGFGAKSARR